MQADNSQTETQRDSSDWQAVAASHVPGLTILYHPDLERVGDRVPLPALGSGEVVLLSRMEPAFAAPGASVSAPLGDAHLSRQPLRLAPSDRAGAISLGRNGSRTTLTVDGEPVADTHVLDADTVTRGVVLLLSGRVVLLLHCFDPYVPTDLPRYDLVGDSVAMLRVRRAIRQVAPLTMPVLLRGESGTGKELVARAIHQSGPRQSAPYITVNLSAMPPSLAAAELFGAGRGAFTGADRCRQGYFATAQGGTLFLDEIGDAPTDVQVLLLRALESGEIQPLGESHAQQVDVRVVAATDSDLESRVRSGGFRAPLLFRLAGFVLWLPALRERRDDFGRLFVHLLRQELATAEAAHRLRPARRPWVPAGLVARLVSYSWPGNVRQLRNVVRQLVVAHRDDEEVRLDMPLDYLLMDTTLMDTTASPVSAPDEPLHPSRASAGRRPATIREDELIAALRAERWHLQAAADRLGIPRSSLYRLIERHPRIRTAASLERREIEESLSHVGGSVEVAAEHLEVSATALRRRMRQLGLSWQPGDG